MKYILDFDRVVFDCDAYMQAIADGNLHDLSVDPAVWDILDVKDFLFADAIAFLKKVEQVEAVIITAMSSHMGPNAEWYQRRKLAESGMGHYVSEVVIMKGDKAQYVQPFVSPGSIFIDDKKEHVESVAKKCPGVTCFQLVRPRGSLESAITTNPAIHVVKDFAELSAIISV